MLRSDLAAQLWPDAERSTRLMNLRPALNYARAGLESQEAIHSSDDWLILGDGIESDWEQVGRVETRVQQARDGDERLVLLYSLNDLVQRPLLEGWDTEWLEPIRLYHEQRRLNSARQLSEELGVRGEWHAALDQARRISEIDPASEDGVRLQLRCLGELDRPGEAQRAFAYYAKHLKTTLGLTVNPSLRRLAEDVATGRFKKSESRPLTTVQQEMIGEVLNVLASEEPERLLPLLSSSKLNWSLVFHGSEMEPILKRALDATSGWSAERSGVAKRLLQVYVQDRKLAEVEALANDLQESADPEDQIAALNFQGIHRKTAMDYPVALERFDRAIELAEAAQNEYLAAVSRANRAILNICFGLYQLGRTELKSSRKILMLRREPNARFGASMVNAWAIAGEIGQHDLDAATKCAQEWRTFAETNGMLAYDALGKLFYGSVLAKCGDRNAREWVLAGIDTAFQSKHEADLLESALPLIYSLDALRLENAAAAASQAARRIAKHLDFRIFPFYASLLSGSPTEARSNTIKSPSELLAYCRTKILASAG